MDSSPSICVIFRETALILKVFLIIKERVTERRFPQH
jgi:hypothetical protein